MKAIIEEFEEPMCFLAYARTQGECWTLVGMDEAEADSCIKEFHATGSITLKLQWAQSSETIKPVGVAKLKGESVHYRMEEVQEIQRG